MLNFEIHLVDNCNLNCASCSHFAPLGEKNELDPIVFENNLKSINSNVLDKIKSVRLMGGEPLLNTNINEICILARKYFRNAEICIVTNGILLKKMHKKFFDVCNINNIKILVTYYNIKNLDKYIEFLKNVLNVNIDYFVGFFEEYGEPKYFNHYVIDCEGKQNFKENYKKCDAIKVWNCLQLVGTKLYCCNIGAYIKYFNKAFGYNIEDIEYLDLSKINDYSEIEKWYKIPKQICKYCDLSKCTQILWKKSEKDISEWILK